MRTITQELSGGDRRSIGASNRIVSRAVKKPALFKELVYGMANPNPLIAMRCADAVEKITTTKPNWLQPFKRFILKKTVLITQQEVRWHIAQIIPRLNLTNSEKKKAFALLLAWAKNDHARSNIVRVFSMQAACDIAQNHPELLNKIMPVIKKFSRSPISSLRSRASKLLKIINKRKK